MTREELEREWAQNMRFYADARFKQLTLWLAAMTLFVTGLAKAPRDELASGVTIQTVIAVVAPMFTAVMWVLEMRAALYFAAHRSRAAHLWPSASVRWAWIGATNALLLMFAGSYAAWFALGVAVDLHLVWRLIVVAVGIVLLAFASLNYPALWRHTEKDKHGLPQSTFASAGQLLPHNEGVQPTGFAGGSAPRPYTEDSS